MVNPLAQKQNSPDSSTTVVFSDVQNSRILSSLGLMGSPSPAGLQTSVVGVRSADSQISMSPGSVPATSGISLIRSLISVAKNQASDPGLVSLAQSGDENATDMSLQMSTFNTAIASNSEPCPERQF